MDGNEKFFLVADLNYTIYILKSVEKKIVDIKDKKSQKKIMQYIERLSRTIPNKPEMWEQIRACKNFRAYELKPKPYRLGCYKYNKYILVVHMWKVQKNKSIKKSKSIKKVCSIVKEVSNEFEKFVRRI